MSARKAQIYLEAKASLEENGFIGLSGSPCKIIEPKKISVDKFLIVRRKGDSKFNSLESIDFQ